MWNNAVDLFVTYMGSGILVGWFVLSLIYLFLKETDSAKRVLFLYFPIIILLLYFNPLFVPVVYGIIGEEIYYRFLWIIPMTMTIAYAAVQIYGKIKDSMKKLYLGGCVLLIVLSGKLIYTNEHFSVADNIYHVPEAVVKICEAIRVEGREVTAAFPVDMIQYVRQYESTICMPYGRDSSVAGWGMVNDLYDMISLEEINVDELVYLTKDMANGSVRPCNYIVIPETTVLVGDFEPYGIVYFDSVDGYDIYFDTNYYIGL